MSKELVTPGSPIRWQYLDRSFGGRAVDILAVSDGLDGNVAGSVTWSTPHNFSGGLSKAGSPVLAGNPFLVVTQDGHSGAGSLALTGAVKGDKVMAVTGITTPADLSSSFESTITVAGHIQQSSATDLSAQVCQFILVHQS